MAQKKFKRKISTNKWAHRRLKFSPNDHDPQRGEDVKALQRAVNDRLVFIGERDQGLKVDGSFGRSTLGRARHVARALGIGLHGAGVSAYVQHLIRHPNLRTPIQRSRGKKWRKENIEPSLKISGNKISGGKTDRERVTAAAMHAAKLYYEGVSHRFYSQPGRWTVDHGVTGEVAGDRSDCSQWFTAMYWSAGAADPNNSNFTGGYTGSLEAHMREISRDELFPGCAVLYGPRGATHHVEMWIGNGDGHTTYKELANIGSQYRDRTIGHGSPPVDYGDIDMISGARFFAPR